MNTEHTLRIRCPTWDHLENFYDAKVKDENVLLARVPFSPPIDSVVVIALELPDGVVVDIDADVEAVRRAPDGKKSAVRLLLRGMDEVRPRLARAVALERQQAGHEEGHGRRASTSIPRTRTGLFVPIPSDAPIDEPVTAIVIPTSDKVPEDVRARYIELEGALATMREKAAHDVLGVDWDAEVADIRLAYFGMVKQYHPDVLSQFDSEEIVHLGSEIFIYINKAYDRLRDSAVAAGKAIAAGPALLPSSGWIADFDDIGVARPESTYRVTDLAAPEPVPVPVKAMSSMAANAPEASENVEVHFSSGIVAAPDEPSETSESASELASESLFDDARKTGIGMAPIDDGIAGSSEADAGSVAIDAAALFAQSRDLIAEKKYDEAREALAQVLEEEPRNREARALYHVAYGHTLIERDNAAAARTQFEVALKHNPDCAEAAVALDRDPAKGRRRRPSLINRIFGR